MSRYPLKIIDDIGHKIGYVIYDNTQDYLISIRVFEDSDTAEMFTQIWEYEIRQALHHKSLYSNNIDSIISHDGHTTRDMVYNYMINNMSPRLYRYFMNKWIKEELI